MQWESLIKLSRWLKLCYQKKNTILSASQSNGKTEDRQTLSRQVLVLSCA